MSRHRRKAATWRNGVSADSVADAPAAPRKAVVYTRVSSIEQAREGFSIPAQQRLLRGYAVDKNLDVIQEYIDIETAKHSGRTNFGEMLAWLKKHRECRVILAEKTDRLYRNLKDYVVLDEMGVEVHLVKEGAILDEDTSSAEKLIHGIRVVLAKNYIDNLSEEVKKGMLEKAEAGIWPSHAPFGYRNVEGRAGKRIIALDPEVAPHVRQLFEDYASGQLTIEQLAVRGHANGFTNRKTGRPHHVATLQYVLRNPLYMGEFDWNGRRFRGTHEPLVSRELWERVQETLTERAVCVTRQRRLVFAFSGQIRCAQCYAEKHLRLLIGSLIKQKYRYYHCEGCKKAGRRVYFPEPVLEAAFRRALGDLVVPSPRGGGGLPGSLPSWPTPGGPDGLWALGKLWREALVKALASQGRPQAATTSAELGSALLTFTGAAVGAWAELAPGHRKRLLGHLTVRSVWDGAQLQVYWRRPYDLVADFVRDWHRVQACARSGQPLDITVEGALQALGEQVVRATLRIDDLARVVE